MNLYPVLTKEACEGKLITIECGWGQAIKVLHAAYGVYSNGNTCGYTYKSDRGRCVASDSIKVGGERAEII